MRLSIFSISVLTILIFPVDGVWAGDNFTSDSGIAQSEFLCDALTDQHLQDDPPIGGIELHSGLKLISTLADGRIHYALPILLQVPVEGRFQSHAAKSDVEASIAFDPARIDAGAFVEQLAGVDAERTSLTLHEYEQLFEVLNGLIDKADARLPDDEFILVSVTRQLLPSGEMRMELTARMERMDWKTGEVVEEKVLEPALAMFLKPVKGAEMPVLSDADVSVTAPGFGVREITRIPSEQAQ